MSDGAEIPSSQGEICSGNYEGSGYADPYQHLLAVILDRVRFFSPGQNCKVSQPDRRLRRISRGHRIRGNRGMLDMTYSHSRSNGSGRLANRRNLSRSCLTVQSGYCLLATGSRCTLAAAS